MSIGNLKANLAGYLGKATKFGREIWAPMEFNGAFPVNIQDQHSPAFDLYFSQDVGAPLTLAADAEEDAYSISVTTGHGLVTGNEFVLFDTNTQRGYTGEVVTVDGANTVNVDRPITSRLPAATTILQQRTHDLTVNGAVTRQTFRVGSALAAEIDITRILFQMTTTNAPEFTDFGDITLGLSRGLVLRVVNGRNSNLWNAKTNANLVNLMYDVTVYEAAKQFNVNGIGARLTYAGQNKHGVTIRLGANEYLEVIIQDDLTSLLSFNMIACGHLVTD
jgi:hypothetical protein